MAGWRVTAEVQAEPVECARRVEALAAGGALAPCWRRLRTREAAVGSPLPSYLRLLFLCARGVWAYLE